MAGIFEVRAKTRARVMMVAYKTGMLASKLKMPTFYNIGAAAIGVGGGLLIKGYEKGRIRNLITTPGGMPSYRYDHDRQKWSTHKWSNGIKAGIRSRLFNCGTAERVNLSIVQNPQYQEVFQKEEPSRIVGSIDKVDYPPFPSVRMSKRSITGAMVATNDQQVCCAIGTIYKWPKLSMDAAEYFKYLKSIFIIK